MSAGAGPNPGGPGATVGRSIVRCCSYTGLFARYMVRPPALNVPVAGKTGATVEALSTVKCDDAV